MVEASSNWTLRTDIARATPCVCGASKRLGLLGGGRRLRGRAGRLRWRLQGGAAAAGGCWLREGSASFLWPREGLQPLSGVLRSDVRRGAAEFDPDAAREVSVGDVVRRSVGEARSGSTTIDNVKIGNNV